ncbi:unnamed protein product [Protopolystoma xenopodis]|uniref:Uncharacterized protein n=1 Tax=Protopolystoma xenopodis TaxID=117903 RepID=A0A3S5CVX5_9PLAT|nr:unnamed protein product [Protopolystoma xenopodis]
MEGLIRFPTPADLVVDGRGPRQPDTQDCARRKGKRPVDPSKRRTTDQPNSSGMSTDENRTTGRPNDRTVHRWPFVKPDNQSIVGCLSCCNPKDPVVKTSSGFARVARFDEPVNVKRAVKQLIERLPDVQTDG